MVAVPVEQLQLLQRQDIALVSKKELLAESIWSTQFGTHRPVSPGHFQSRFTAIGPARLNRVRVLVGRFLPVDWPRPLEWLRSLSRSSASPCPYFCSPAAVQRTGAGGGVSGGGPSRP
jgi:hypothetical protein